LDGIALDDSDMRIGERLGSRKDRQKSHSTCVPGPISEPPAARSKGRYAVGLPRE
jgi:hypothetical protein